LPFTDSLDKIIMTYFASLTKEEFEYRGIIFAPKNLTVSPLILRGYTCPERCGGCCPRFSLDYLPSEKRPPYINATRMIPFNGKLVEVYSDMQLDREGEHFCRNLNMDDGRCGIHGKHPFSCDFELIRFFVADDSTRLSQQLFGRGWQFLRVDGERGAKCEMTPVDKSTTDDVIRKLTRLKEWCSYFGISNWTPEILRWIDRGDAAFPLHLSLENKKRLF
jgi:hypothetical protein